MVTYKINERSKMKENIRKEIMGMNLTELNELGEFIRDVKVMNDQIYYKGGYGCLCCTKN